MCMIVAIATDRPLPDYEAPGGWLRARAIDVGGLGFVAPSQFNLPNRQLLTGDDGCGCELRGGFRRLASRVDERALKRYDRPKEAADTIPEYRRRMLCRYCLATYLAGVVDAGTEVQMLTCWSPRRGAKLVARLVEGTVEELVMNGPGFGDAPVVRYLRPAGWEPAAAGRP